MKHTVEVLYTFDEIAELLAETNGVSRENVRTYNNTGYTDSEDCPVDGDTFMFCVRKNQGNAE